MKHGKKKKKKLILWVENWGGKAFLHPQLVCRGEWASRGGGEAQCRQSRRGEGPPALPTCMQGEGEVANRKGRGAVLCPWLADRREGVRGGQERGEDMGKWEGWENLTWVACVRLHLLALPRFPLFPLPFPCTTPHQHSVTHRRASSPPPSSLCLPQLLPPCYVTVGTFT